MDLLRKIKQKLGHSKQLLDEKKVKLKLFDDTYENKLETLKE